MPHGAIPFPFGDCKICKDRATGLHYGVNTCEGCKGFFKRSLGKSDRYKCFFGGTCEISPQNRNRCKSCRFQRCLDAGMAEENVKMGRIPKAEKEKALAAEFEKNVCENGVNEKDEYNDMKVSRVETALTSSSVEEATHMNLRSPGGSRHNMYSDQESAEYPLSSLSPTYNGINSSDGSANTTESRHRSATGGYYENLHPSTLQGLEQVVVEISHLEKQSPIKSNVPLLSPAEHYVTSAAAHTHPPKTGCSDDFYTPRQHNTRRAHIQKYMPYDLSTAHTLDPNLEFAENIRHAGIDNNLHDSTKSSAEQLHCLNKSQLLSQESFGEPWLAMSNKRQLDKYCSFNAETAAAILLSSIKKEKKASDGTVMSPNCSLHDQQLETLVYKQKLRSTINDTSYEEELFQHAIPKLSFAAIKLQESIAPKLRIVDAIAAGQIELHEFNRLEGATYEQVKTMWLMLFGGIAESNKLLFSLAQSIPGFCGLDDTDRALQLECNYLEVWAIVSTLFFKDGESILLIEPFEGQGPRPFYSKWWMSHFLPQDFVRNMHDFASSFQNLQLDRVEFVAVCAMCLMDTAHGRDVINTVELEELHSFYWSFIKFHLVQRLDGQASVILSTLDSLLYKLKALCARQVNWIADFSMDSPPAYCCQFIHLSRNPSQEELDFFRKCGVEPHTHEAKNVNDLLFANFD